MLAVFGSMSHVQSTVKSREASMTFVGKPALSFTVALKLPLALSGFGKIVELGHGLLSFSQWRSIRPHGVHQGPLTRRLGSA